MGLDSVDLCEESKLIVDVDNNTDSSQSDEAQHQVTLTSQGYDCQPVPIPANRYRNAGRWFPDATSSSSDETHDEMAPSEPAHRVDPYEEDEETEKTKRILV